METQIISGFPGVGKTVFCRQSALRVMDSDSRTFSWRLPGVRHPEFPQNYLSHIREHLGQVHYICISSHAEIREALAAQKIPYTLVYPARELKDEYLARYRQRRSLTAFVDFMQDHWDGFIMEIERETFPSLIRLERSQFLADVIPPAGGLKPWRNPTPCPRADRPQ